MSDRWPSGPSTRVRRCSLGLQLFWSADIERGRELFQELADSAPSAQGSRGREPRRCGYLGFLAWRSGDWAEADRYVADSLDVFLQFGVLTRRMSFRPPSSLPTGARSRRTGPST